MTTLKFDSKLGAAAAAALEPHIRPIYDRPDCTRLAIIELRHIERTQPAAGSDKDPSVRVRITQSARRSYSATVLRGRPAFRAQVASHRRTSLPS